MEARTKSSSSTTNTVGGVGGVNLRDSVVMRLTPGVGRDPLTRGRSAGSRRIGMQCHVASLHKCIAMLMREHDSAATAARAGLTPSKCRQRYQPIDTRNLPPSSPDNQKPWKSLT